MAIELSKYTKAKRKKLSAEKITKGVNLGWESLGEGSNKVRRGWLGKAPADPRMSLGKAPKKQPSRAL